MAGITLRNQTQLILSENWKNQNENKFTDLVFILDEDKRIEGHSMVLSAFCGLIKRIMMLGKFAPCEKIYITVKNIEVEAFKMFFKFMYTGSTTLGSESEYYKFEQIASLFQMHDVVATKSYKTSEFNFGSRVQNIKSSNSNQDTEKDFEKEKLPNSVSESVESDKDVVIREENVSEDIDNEGQIKNKEKEYEQSTSEADECDTEENVSDDNDDEKEINNKEKEDNEKAINCKGKENKPSSSLKSCENEKLPKRKGMVQLIDMEGEMIEKDYVVPNSFQMESNDNSSPPRKKAKISNSFQDKCTCFCNKTFKNLKTYKYHLVQKHFYKQLSSNYHFDWKQKKYKCNICAKVFHTKISALQHIGFLHSKIIEYCNKKQKEHIIPLFSAFENRIKNQGDARDIEENEKHVPKRKIGCEFCEQKFLSSSKLLMHLTFAHFQQKIKEKYGEMFNQTEIHCNWCSLKPIDFHTLLGHIGVTHWMVTKFISQEYLMKIKGFKEMTNEMKHEQTKINDYSTDIKLKILQKKYETGTISCDYCNKCPTNLDVYLKHLSVFHFKENLRLKYSEMFEIKGAKCKWCSIIPDGELAMVLHLGVKHRRVIEFLSPEVFEKKSYLQIFGSGENLIEAQKETEEDASKKKSPIQLSANDLTEENVLKCDYCVDFSTRDVAILWHHIAQEHFQGYIRKTLMREFKSNSGVCKICSHQTDVLELYIKHVVSHESIDEFLNSECIKKCPKDTENITVQSTGTCNNQLSNVSKHTGSMKKTEGISESSNFQNKFLASKVSSLKLKKEEPNELTDDPETNPNDKFHIEQEHQNSSNKGAKFTSLTDSSQLMENTLNDTCVKLQQNLSNKISEMSTDGCSKTTEKLTDPMESNLKIDNVFSVKESMEAKENAMHENKSLNCSSDLKTQVEITSNIVHKDSKNLAESVKNAPGADLKIKSTKPIDSEKYAVAKSTKSNHLKSHDESQTSVNSSTKMRYECDDCFFPFSNQEEYIVHLIRVHFKEEFEDKYEGLYVSGKGKCKYCCNQSKDPESFYIHMGYSHQKALVIFPKKISQKIPSFRYAEKLYCPCDIKASFSSYYGLKAHLFQTHYAKKIQERYQVKESKKLPCPYCKNKFCFPQEIRSRYAHIGIHHNKVIDFCSQEVLDQLIQKDLIPRTTLPSVSPLESKESISFNTENCELKKTNKTDDSTNKEISEYSDVLGEIRICGEELRRSRIDLLKEVQKSESKLNKKTVNQDKNTSKMINEDAGNRILKTNGLSSEQQQKIQENKENNEPLNDIDSVTTNKEEYKLNIERNISREPTEEVINEFGKEAVDSRKFNRISQKNISNRIQSLKNTLKLFCPCKKTVIFHDYKSLKIHLVVSHYAQKLQEKYQYVGKFYPMPCPFCDKKYFQRDISETKYPSIIEHIGVYHNEVLHFCSQDILVQLIQNKILPRDILFTDNPSESKIMSSKVCNTPGKLSKLADSSGTNNSKNVNEKNILKENLLGNNKAVRIFKKNAAMIYENKGHSDKRKETKEESLKKYPWIVSNEIDEASFQGSLLSAQNDIDDNIFSNLNSDHVAESDKSWGNNCVGIKNNMKGSKVNKIAKLKENSAKYEIEVGFCGLQMDVSQDETEEVSAEMTGIEDCREKENGMNDKKKGSIKKEKEIINVKEDICDINENDSFNEMKEIKEENIREWKKDISEIVENNIIMIDENDTDEHDTLEFKDNFIGIKDEDINEDKMKDISEIVGNDIIMINENEIDDEHDMLEVKENKIRIKDEDKVNVSEIVGNDIIMIHDNDDTNDNDECDIIEID